MLGGKLGLTAPRMLLKDQSLRSLSYAGGRVPPTVQNVISGQWVESSADRWIDVPNPATNETVTRSGCKYVARLILQKLGIKLMNFIKSP